MTNRCITSGCPERPGILEYADSGKHGHHARFYDICPVHALNLAETRFRDQGLPKMFYDARGDPRLELLERIHKSLKEKFELQMVQQD